MISVITPIYKVEPYLDRCVQSIVDQTYQNLEILLVDDGSPDNCPAMCDAWAQQDSRIKVIHKANGGLSDARNAGMAAAAGEYIAFVDSDDWIAPEMLEKLLYALDRDHSDIAACTVKMVWEDDTPDELLTVQTNCVLDSHRAQAALLKEDLLKQPVWYKLYRSDIIRGIPFEVGKYHEDVFWSYQAIGAANRVSLIDYVGYYYTQRSDSIMGEGYSLKRLDAVEAYKKRYQYIAVHFPELEPAARISIINACIYHGQMTLKHLRNSERERAFSYLTVLNKQYTADWKDTKSLKITHRIWLGISKLSLQAVCRVKNMIGVGL